MYVVSLKSKNTSRVPLAPIDAEKLIKNGYSVIVESGIGENALFFDECYEGCEIIKNIDDICNKIVCSIQGNQSGQDGQAINNVFIFFVIFDDESMKSVKHMMYSIHGTSNANTKIKMRFIIIASQVVVDFSKILLNNDIVIDVILFNLDNLPRITRAQSMDVLSSQNNIAGYLAVIEAAKLSQKVFPMMTTAAGNIKPSKVLVIGAGVAGLQAIATAKRLGAIVWACDVREESQVEVESLGAKFIKIPIFNNNNVAGGYVTDFSEEHLESQKCILREHILASDIVICTALIRGKKAPIVVTTDMVNSMKNGSVIVDLAVASGGNCELSTNGIIKKNGVTIVGYEKIIDNAPFESSNMLSKNYLNFLLYIAKFFKNDAGISDDDKSMNVDEIIGATRCDLA